MHAERTLFLPPLNCAREKKKTPCDASRVKTAFPKKHKIGDRDNSTKPFPAVAKHRQNVYLAFERPD